MTRALGRLLCALRLHKLSRSPTQPFTGSVMYGCDRGCGYHVHEEATSYGEWVGGVYRTRAERTRLAVNRLLPANGREHRFSGDPCDFCGCARSRCEQAPERFGTDHCCDQCDHRVGGDE